MPPSEGGNDGLAIPERSRRCSTQTVEWVAAAKSGCSRIATSAGMLVATPSTTVSASALSILRLALFAVRRPDDELGHQVVVVLADRVARCVPGVEPHSGAARFYEFRDRSRRRGEAATGGILGVYPHLDRVTVSLHVALRETELLAGCDPELPLDEVEAGDQLCYGVLDLSRVFISKK